MSITITNEFNEALNIIAQRQNLTISGRAGTGKSTLLRLALSQIDSNKILVVAPTGVAALNVGGITIHRAFSFRPGMYPSDLGPDGKWGPSKQLQKVLRALDVLVIDEISMVRADLFDMMDIALRTLRNNDRPFGGVQLILVGDLLQLPPVVEENESQLFNSHWKTPFFFSSQVYQRLELKHVQLMTVWRQSDSHFIDLLNQVREGNIDGAGLELLNRQVDPYFELDDEWVALAPHKRQVAKINQSHLRKLEGPILTSEAEYNSVNENYDFGGEDILNYAVGARAMTIINDQDERFVNGSFGTIVAATNKTITMVMDETDQTVELEKHTWSVHTPALVGGQITSNVTGTIYQFPVILAWAVTIHKSQGKTIPKLFIDLSNGIAMEGQLYVALSRAVSLENLRLNRPIKPKYVKANNSLVRVIRRNTSEITDTTRFVFVTFDGVDFGVSRHVIRIHVVIVNEKKIVADFGTWINPMADLGDFREANNIPPFGLAPAPRLGDFWPLLLRQAEGGLVIGDQLPMLEQAVKYQHRGMEICLGLGYDISELNLSLSATGVDDKAREMAQMYLDNRLNISEGTVVPPADANAVGALFVPTWSGEKPPVLDWSRTNDNDAAWASYAGADVPPELAQAENHVQPAMSMAAWANERNAWNETVRAEVRAQVDRADAGEVELQEVTNHAVDFSEYFRAGTRVALTGNHGLLFGKSVTDDEVKELFAQRDLKWKSSVSRTQCDILVAHDPSTMSRKAQAAREYGHPIVALDDFEEWYQTGPFLPALGKPATQIAKIPSMPKQVPED